MAAMDKKTLLAVRDYFNAVHKITVRAIGTLEDGDLDFRPKPGMRSPRELVFHMYAQERILARAAKQGSFTMEAAALSSPENEAVWPELGAIHTVRELAAFAEDRHQEAESIVNGMTEEEVARTVESPFGAFPAWRYFAFASDEHWHHRGQLYTYLRLLGKEPPMLYDYGL